MSYQEMSEQQPQTVHITGIHVPFWSVVGFMVKWSIASIPAFFILALIQLVVGTLVLMFLIGLIHFFAPGAIGTFFMGLFRAFVPGASAP
jgi:hypothetical protein